MESVSLKFSSNDVIKQMLKVLSLPRTRVLSLQLVNGLVEDAVLQFSPYGDEALR